MRTNTFWQHTNQIPWSKYTKSRQMLHGFLTPSNWDTGQWIVTYKRMISCFPPTGFQLPQIFHKSGAFHSGWADPRWRKRINVGIGGGFWAPSHPSDHCFPRRAADKKTFPKRPRYTHQTGQLEASTKGLLSTAGSGESDTELPTSGGSLVGCLEWPRSIGTIGTTRSRGAWTVRQVLCRFGQWRLELMNFSHLVL
jgi:hypothetical protein